MRLSITLRVVAAAVLAVVAQTASAELVEQAVLAADSNYESEQAEEEVLVTTGVSLEQRMAEFDSRLSMIESTPTSTSSCSRKAISSSRISTNSIGCPSNYAGFELAVLKPHVGALNGNILGLAGSLTSTFDFEAAPRIFIGRERSDGLGVRGTYFQFDHNSEASDVGIVTGLELHTLDLELTSRTQFCGSDAMLTAGFRYAHLEQDYAIGGGALGFETEGAGMTIGGRMTRNLGRTGWDLIVGARASLLLTDNELNVDALGININSDESTMKILEARIGVTRTRQLSGGAQLVSEFAFETQNWDSAAIAGIVGTELALYGPTFALGLNF